MTEHMYPLYTEHILMDLSKESGRSTIQSDKSCVWVGSSGYYGLIYNGFEVKHPGPCSNRGCFQLASGFCVLIHKTRSWITHSFLSDDSFWFQNSIFLTSNVPWYFKMVLNHCYSFFLEMRGT